METLRGELTAALARAERAERDLAKHRGGSGTGYDSDKLTRKDVEDIARAAVNKLRIIGGGDVQVIPAGYTFTINLRE